MGDLKKEKIEILLVEFDRLHQDRRNWDNNIFQLFVLLVTITSVGVAAILQHRLQAIELSHTNGEPVFAFWDYFIMSYPYMTYLFALIFLILSGSITHNSASLLKIENKINELVDQKVLFWENVIIHKSYYKPSSTYFLSTVLLSIFFIVLDIYCINISLKLFEGTIYKTAYIWLNSICIGAIVLLLIYHISLEKKIINKRIVKFFK